MMCFICRFNVYFSRNQRKCSQNGEDGNFKNLNLRQMIYHLVGHEILNKTVHFVCHFNVTSRENVRKITQNENFKMQFYEANDISSCSA